MPEFKYLTPDDGLSQSTVETIYQDSEGFMWFGTLEGLNKYEGQNQNVVVYKHNPNDPNSLGSNEIESIYEDRSGNLWIGTDWGGLNRYNREKDEFERFNAAEELHVGRLSGDTIHSLFEDSKGNFWVGAYNGLNLMNREKETFKNFVADPKDSTSLSNSYIVDIFEDRRGDVWVGTRNGLNRMSRTNRDSATFTRYYIDAEYLDQSTTYIQAIYEDSNGVLWVGTESGLFIFDREDERFIPSDIGMPASVTVLSIKEDWKNVLWIGTENEGVYALPPENSIVVPYKHSEDQLYGINSSSVHSLYESRDKILWFGTFDGGVNYLNRKENKFTHYRSMPGVEGSLNENSIFSFLYTQGKYLWIGTDGGGINLFHPETKQFTAIRSQPGDPDGLPSDVILDMIEDSHNRVWIGTYRGGLVRYNPDTKKFKTYKYEADNPNSLSQDQVFKVIEDKNGNIWAGTNGSGLNKLIDEENGIFERWNPESETHYFPQSYLRDIVEDSAGYFWVTTYGGGIVHFDPETREYESYTGQENTISSSIVLDVYIAEDGKVWVGTKGGGLAWFDEDADKFRAYTTQDGLPNDIVNAIIEDHHRDIWVSTNDGLSRFNPTTENFENFSVNDGLQSREFKPNAVYRMPDSTLFFGGINGFNRFHPDSIKKNTETSPVALTDFLLNNKSVSIGGESPLKKHINHAENIVLPHTASIISFKFSVLNFNPDQGYTYAYMLDGFDSEWNQVGGQNMATYTNLDPGEYTFKVKTANNDGIWGEQIKQVGLTITPPFWRTYWFYLLMGILAIAAVVGWVKYRTRQVEQINKMLEKQVAERTSELEESNLDLKKAMQDLQETKEELVRNAHKAGMADIATGVLHNIGNVLNSVTTSTSITADVLEKSKLRKLFKANELLREHKDHLEEFLTKDPQGQKLTDYYLKLDEALKKELKTLESHNKRLDKKVALINDVIAAQQSYASIGSNQESSDIKLMLEDALTIFANSLDRHSITVEKHLEETSPILVQKTKLVHVILNIVKNAKDAIVESGRDERRISIRLFQEEKRVYLEISDTGRGINKKNLDKIFNHGFTTKKNGHGFGLHSSANYMTEMGGKINVRNKEEGTGAVFILSFPVKAEKPDEVNV